MVSALLLIFSACFLGLVSARIPPLYEAEHAELHFERFIEQYNKNYAHEHEKQARFKIFKENLEKINQFNEESTHAQFGVTQFSDLTSEEFVETYLGAFQSANFTNRGCKDVSDAQITDSNAPESFDWRSKNVVTRVKNQKRCGSCYAFSSTGNIEGQYAIRYNRLSEFSEQQIIDCDRGSNGCRGGFMPTAFVTLINQGGLELESSYPYRGVQGRCNFQPGKAMVRLTGCNSYYPSSQDKLKQILFSVGPIAIGVKASNFQHYRGGIMSDNFCGRGNVDHAVLLVGYGTENGHPYWLIKNSWGESFGESGYFRVSRAPQSDSCGLFNELMSSAIIM